MHNKPPDSALGIAVCHIEKGKPWQDLIEAQFKVQLRLSEVAFRQASTFEEIQESATMGTDNPIQNYYDDSTPRKYIKVSDIFFQTGVDTGCNSSFKIQLAEFLGPTDGSVPINLTC